MKTFLSLMIFSATTAMANAPMPVETKPAQSPELHSIREELKGHNQILTCHAVEDCLNVPTGARPCGGPSGYEIASRQNPELDKVLELASKTTEIEAKLNENKDVGSICTVLMPPELRCAETVCQKLPNDPTTNP